MRHDTPYSPFHVDRRRAERLVAALPCRVVLANGSAFIGETISISADGVALVTDAPTAPGEVVDVLVAQLGFSRGVVARPVEDGIAIAFDEAGRAERARAVAWLEEALEGERPDLRAHARHLPPPAPIDFSIDGRPATPVSLVDLSFGGARLLTLERPPVGTPVRLGPLPARVARHTQDGVAIVFSGP